MKKHVKVLLKIRSFFIYLLYFIMILFWFSQCEERIYDLPRVEWLEWWIVIILFIGTLISTGFAFVASGKILKTIIIALFTIFIIFIFLDFRLKTFREYKAQRFGEFNFIEDTIKDNKPFTGNYTLLYEKDNLYLVGKIRTGKKRYLDVASKSCYSFKQREVEILAKLIPSDFVEYAKLVDGELVKKDDCALIFRSRDFFAWQYPDYLFLVLQKKIQEKRWGQQFDIIHYYEENRLGPPISLLEDIVTNDIPYRLKIYWQAITLPFNSPYYRTDLVDDPYFLIWRGEIDKAREGLDKIPKERREFLIEHYGDVLGVED